MYLSRSSLLIAMCVSILPAHASDAEAAAVSANIQAVHTPWGGIVDPIYASPTSNQIVGYTRCGDSALWTGAYLAAESFRYNVTQSPDALNNVKSALSALNGMSAVTGDNRLARCAFAADSPYAQGIESEEAGNTIVPAGTWVWVDDTTRDQIVGAFFGLCAAFDLVNDPAVKSGVSNLTTLLLRYIHDHAWSPNDDISSTFLLRPEELQTIVQVGRHINPNNGISGPLFVPPVETAVLVDVLDNSSYFKFNLDYMSFYNLVRLQNNGDNRSAYQIVRNYTASHRNAFFDIIDYALNGPNASRDAEMRTLLEQVLLRPRRDNYVDLTKTVPLCGSEACQPVPVALRPPTDFLWQRDPFQLSGGGSGIIENNQIDYILPYWMARYYGVIQDVTVQSAASASNVVAPGSLASMYGTNLAPGPGQVATQPVPTALDHVTLTVTDSAGTPRSAPLLYASPGQINFEVPEGTAAGVANFSVANGGTPALATQIVQNVAPAFFTMNASGVAAALAVSSPAGNPAMQTPVPVFECNSSGCSSVPIALNAASNVYLSFYGTGIRNRSSQANVRVTVNRMSVPVLYAGPAPGFIGLDQVNVSLPASLGGSGTSNVVLAADGAISNTVTIDIQ